MILNLKKILDDKNISVNQLHKMTGISRTTLDPLVKSDTIPKKTRFETLERISEALNINLNSLIDFESKSKWQLELLDIDERDYSGLDNEMIERLIIKGEYGTEKITFLIIVRYVIDDSLLKLFPEERKLLDDILEYDGPDDPIQIYEKINDKIKEKALVYEPKQMYFSQKSLFVENFLNEKPDSLLNGSLQYPPNKHLDLIKKSNNLDDHIMSNEFIREVVAFLESRYDLKNRVFCTTSKLFGKDYYGKETDTLAIHFHSKNKMMNKSVTYTYKKNK